MQWSVVAALVVVVFYAPAVVAQTVTAPSEPVPFLTRPWTGWTFTARVLVSSLSAEAASPGAALQRAREHFARPAAPLDGAASTTSGDDVGPTLEPTAVKLLYLPSDTRSNLPALADNGNKRVRVDTSPSLVWAVYGRSAGTNAEGAIGLLDFNTGRLVWDIRTGNSGGNR